MQIWKEFEQRPLLFSNISFHGKYKSRFTNAARITIKKNRAYYSARHWHKGKTISNVIYGCVTTNRSKSAAKLYILPNWRMTDQFTLHYNDTELSIWQYEVINIWWLPLGCLLIIYVSFLESYTWISLHMRTNSLYTCKYQEYISFKPNLKEAYSSFLMIFFDCIRYSRDEREKTKLFNSFLPSKDINVVFSYVLHNYFLILD